MIHTRLGAAVLAVAMTACAIPAAAAELPADTADYLRKSVDGGTYVGVIVGLVDGDQVTIQSFGRASKETGKAPDADTGFAIGSITKTFTATLLASEVIAGRMKLDDPVQKYMPADTTITQVGDRPMTLAHVATHLSGLPRMPPSFAPTNPADPWGDYFAGFDDAKLWEAMRTVKPARAPEAGSEYSNFGFGLLGTLVARSAGTSYDALVSERIFKPLGMTRSHMAPHDATRQPIAQGYDRAGKPAQHWTFQSLAGAGAIYSTMTDMLAYLRVNMAVAAKTPSATPLHQAMAMAQQPRADMGGGKIGLAWITAPNGIRMHDGETIGFSSFLGFTMDGTRGVVVLANTIRLEVTSRVGLHLLNSSAPLPMLPPAEVALAPGMLAQYVGRYMVTPEQHVVVTPREGGLDVQLPGQASYPVFASAPDHFYWKIVAAQADFERDAQGRIMRMVLHQNGARQRWPRLGDDGKPVPQPARLALSAEQLDAYVGRFHIDPRNPRAILAITREGDQLMARPNAQQPPVPIFSERADHFEFDTRDMDLDFERDAAGKVIAVTAKTAQNSGRGERLPETSEP
jgi:CubicO group peptidase (beta-lactamase class C family)